MSHLGGVLLACLAVAAGPALADDDTRSTPRKEGFLVGFGAGLGETFPCEECLSFAGHFTIGAMARERITVVADFAVVGGDDDETGSLLVGALAVQFWPHERTWLRVGLGVGRFYNAHWVPLPFSPAVVAVVAAGGFELVQDGAFTVDAQVRCAFLVRSAVLDGGHQSVALGIGLNWY